MNSFIEYVFEGIEIPEEDIEECGFNEWCFETYYAIGYLFRPKRVMEIGTRRGYSLVALCKGCKDIKYLLSCDNESYIEGSQKIAIFNVEKAGYFGQREFVTMSSLDPKFKEYIKDKKFDVISVDGNHDLPGVVSDLELCVQHLEVGGIMIVDDYTYILDVKKAVDDFVKKYDLGLLVIDSYRGTALIQRRV